MTSSRSDQTHVQRVSQKMCRNSKVFISLQKFNSYWISAFLREGYNTEPDNWHTISTWNIILLGIPRTMERVQLLSQTFRETPPATFQFWDTAPSVTPNVPQLFGLPKQPVLLNSPKKAPQNAHAILTSIWVVKHAVQDSAPDAWTANFRSWITWLQWRSTPVWWSFKQNRVVMFSLT